MEHLIARFSWFRILLIYGLPLCWLFLLLSLLHATNPVDAGPAIILIAFILIYLFTLSVLCACSHLFIKVLQLFVWRNKHVSMRRLYYALSIIALAPVLMIALNTLGQLAMTEFLLIVVLVGVGCFYVIRRN